MAKIRNTPSLADLSAQLAALGAPPKAVPQSIAAPQPASGADVIFDFKNQPADIQGRPYNPFDDVSQKLNQMAPLPSANPSDLIPGKADLTDVQARLDALTNASPPSGGSDLFSKNSAILRKLSQPQLEDQGPGARVAEPLSNQGRPWDYKPQVFTPKFDYGDQPGQAAETPAAPLPLAPYDPSQLTRQPSEYDDIKSIMEAQQKIRAQQMALTNPQGDPWMKALVGLGGLGGDVLSASGKNDFMNAATGAYQAPFDEKRALMMKALDNQVADQRPLFDLAKARANREATFENQKAMLTSKLDQQNKAAAAKLANDKALFDYKNPTEFEQRKAIAGLKGKNGAAGPGIRPKDAMSLGRGAEAIKGMQHVIQYVHSLDDNTWKSIAGGSGPVRSFLDKVQRSSGMNQEEREFKLNYVKNMLFPVAIAMANGGTPTDKMLEDAHQSFVDLSRDNRATRNAKVRATMEKLFNIQQGSLNGLKTAGYDIAGKYQDQLDQLRNEYLDQVQSYQGQEVPAATENKNKMGPIPPGKVRFKSPDDGSIRDYDQSLERDLLDAQFVPMGKSQ